MLNIMIQAFKTILFFYHNNHFRGAITQKKLVQYSIYFELKFLHASHYGLYHLLIFFSILDLLHQFVNYVVG